MSDQIILSEEDVVSMAVDTSFAETSTSTGEEFIVIMANLIYQHTKLQESEAARWVMNGVNCKVLLAQGGGWQKGKIRICFEFVPDNLTPTKTLIPSNTISPLDDLRSQLNPE